MEPGITLASDTLVLELTAVANRRAKRRRKRRRPFAASGTAAKKRVLVHGAECRCHGCKNARDDEKWERIFKEKFEDPTYYTRDCMAAFQSALSDPIQNRNRYGRRAGPSPSE